IELGIAGARHRWQASPVARGDGDDFSGHSGSEARQQVAILRDIDVLLPIYIHAVVLIGVHEVGDVGDKCGDRRWRSALREGVELRVVVLDAYQGLLTGGPRGHQRVDISLREIMKLYGSIPIAIEVDARSRRKVD